MSHDFPNARPSFAERQQEQERAQRDTLSVTLTVQQARDLETAVVDLPELAYHAADALDTLSAGLSMGYFDGGDLYPILSLFARALKSAETKESPALQAFDPVLRKALSAYEEARRQEEMKA